MKQDVKKGTGIKQIENVVLMENLSSSEHFLRENEEPRRVLEAIDLVIKREEAWGISARTVFEIKLLLEIIANIRPYDSGRCVLIERGMLRHKRIILQHVFYIGNSDMLYNNMNVLEFMMFAAAKSGRSLGPNARLKPVELQEQLFEFILDMGLGSISLTSNALLTKEEKAVVTLMVAARSDSMMIVFNLPEYEFDEVLTDAIAKISDFVRRKGKTLIIGTQDSLLIEKACSHTAFIAEGKIIYQGTVLDLRMSLDKIEVIVRDKDIYLMLDKLAPLLPDCRLSVKDGSLLISRGEEKLQDTAHIYRKILEAGFTPEYVEINPKTVRNAYEELILEHDLQNRLF